MFKRGLLATDLSEIADCMLGFIPSLIEQGMEQLDIVHSTDVRYPGGQAASHDPGDIDDKLQGRVEYITSKYDITVQAHNKRGYPPEQILNTAHEIDADLIIAGTRGHGWLSETLVGSTTSDLIRITKKPLLLGRFKKSEDTDGEIPPLMTSNPWKKILAGTDMSDTAGRVEDVVKNLCGYSEAVRLVSVYTNKMAKNYSRQEIEEHLEEVCAECPLDWQLEDGVTSQVLESVADEWGASLIVVGKRGGGALRKLLLGSTPDELCRFSKHHLLVIP